MAEVKIEDFNSITQVSDVEDQAKFVIHRIADASPDRQEALITTQLFYDFLKLKISNNFLDYKGVWAAGAFGVGDVSFHGGKPYMCKVARTASNTDDPATDTTGWVEIGKDFTIANNTITVNQLKTTGTKAAGKFLKVATDTSQLEFVDEPTGGSQVAANSLVPTGGSAHYALIKASDTNRDVEWDLIREDSLADDAVTEDKISDGSIVNTHLKNIGVADNADVRALGYTPQGVPGTISLHLWKGLWASSKTYREGDYVKHSSEYWIATGTTTNNEPSGSSTHWKLLTATGGGGGSVANLDNIGNVNISNVADGQVLAWDDGDSRWENKSLPAAPTVTSLGLGDSFTDVAFANNTLTFTQKDGTTDKTIDLSTLGGGTALSGLGAVPGVNITSVAAGNLLQYVAGTDNEWQNVAPSWLPLSGGGVLTKTTSGTVLNISGVNTGNSTVFEVITASTGDQKGFGIKTTGEGLDWVQFTKSAGGNNKPGIQLGSGSSSRDVNLYRDSANHLKTDDSLIVAELEVLASGLGQTRTNLGLGTAFTSATYASGTFTVTKADGTTEDFALSTGGGAGGLGSAITLLSSGSLPLVQTLEFTLTQDLVDDMLLVINFNSGTGSIERNSPIVFLSNEITGLADEFNSSSAIGSSNFHKGRSFLFARQTSSDNQITFWKSDEANKIWARSQSQTGTISITGYPLQSAGGGTGTGTDTTIWKGAYDGSTAYSIGNIVSHISEFWIAKVAGTGNAPSDASLFWQKLTGVPNGEVGSLSFSSGRILNGNKIVVDTITNVELADEAVLAANISPGAVTRSKMLENAVGRDQLAITGAKTTGHLVTLGDGTASQFVLTDPSTLGGGELADRSIATEKLASVNLREIDADSEYFAADNVDILNSVTLGTSSPSNEFYTQAYLSAGPHGSISTNELQYLQALGNNYMAIPREVYENVEGPITRLFYSGRTYNISNVRVNTTHPGWTGGYKVINGVEFVALRFDGISHNLFSEKTVSGGNSFNVVTATVTSSWTSAQIGAGSNATVYGVVDVGTKRWVAQYDSGSSTASVKAFTISDKTASGADDLTLDANTYNSNADNLGQLSKTEDDDHILLLSPRRSRVDVYNVSDGSLDEDLSFVLHDDHSNASGIDADFRHIYVGEKDFSARPKAWAYLVDNIGERDEEYDIEVNLVVGKVGRIMGMWNNGAIRWIGIEQKDATSTDNDNLDVKFFAFSVFSGEHDSNHDWTLDDPELADFYGNSTDGRMIILSTEKNIKEYAYTGAATASNSKGEFALLKSDGSKVSFKMIREDYVEFDENVVAKTYLELKQGVNLNTITKSGVYHIPKAHGLFGIPNDLRNNFDWSGKLWVTEEKKDGFSIGSQVHVPGIWTAASNGQMLVTGGMENYSQGTNRQTIHNSFTQIRIGEHEIPFLLRFKDSEIAFAYPDSYENIMPAAVKLDFCYDECGDEWRTGNFVETDNDFTSVINVNYSNGWWVWENNDLTNDLAFIELRNENGMVIYFRRNMGSFASVDITRRTPNTGTEENPATDVTTTQNFPRGGSWNNSTRLIGGNTYWRSFVDISDNTDFWDETLNFDIKFKRADGTFIKGAGSITVVNHDITFDSASTVETVNWSFDGLAVTKLRKETANVPPDISQHTALSTNSYVGLINFSDANNNISYGKIVDTSGILQTLELDDTSEYQRFDTEAHSGDPIAGGWEKTKENYKLDEKFLIQQGYSLPRSGHRPIGSFFYLLNSYTGASGSVFPIGMYVAGYVNADGDIQWRKIDERKLINNSSSFIYYTSLTIEQGYRFPDNPSDADQFELLEDWEYATSYPKMTMSSSGAAIFGFASGKIANDGITFGEVDPNPNTRIAEFITEEWQGHYLTVLYLRTDTGTFDADTLDFANEALEAKVEIYTEPPSLDTPSSPDGSYRLKHASSGDYTAGGNETPANAHYKKFTLHYESEGNIGDEVHRRILYPGLGQTIGINFSYVEGGELKFAFPNKVYTRGTYTYSTTTGAWSKNS